MGKHEKERKPGDGLSWVEKDVGFEMGQHRASTVDEIRAEYEKAGILGTRMDHVRFWHEPENRAWGRGDWRWVEESNRKGNFKRLVDGESVNLGWGEALGWLMAAVLVGSVITALIMGLILAGNTTGA